MAEIRNDDEFRTALAGLSLEDQRLLGCRFVESLLGLSDDERIAHALDAARRGGSAEEMALALKTAKRAVIDSHTKCGREGDWSHQAGYFIARAAAACVASHAQEAAGPLAWQAAMACRMARMAESMAADSDQSGQETERQYRIAEDFLKERKGDQS
ncbi:MAG: hypothetical protein C0605_09910 [Hyphomicrobiales bacterium]|nr:MAG: hypothetical protein C0605_09910 [Hyphomicrobiales bacterium]